MNAHLPPELGDVGRHLLESVWCSTARCQPRPFFLDSPLGIRATEVFRKHASSLDQNVDVGRLLNSPQLQFTETVEESRAIARLTGFHIIIAASGMCDAGRISLFSSSRTSCRCWQEMPPSRRSPASTVNGCDHLVARHSAP